MIERLSRRWVTSPALASWAKWKLIEDAGTSSCSARVPAAMPPSPACTSKRNAASRCSCARADKAHTAFADSMVSSVNSINVELSKYVETVKRAMRPLGTITRHLGKLQQWCPEEDSNLHALASAST